MMIRRAAAMFMGIIAALFLLSAGFVIPGFCGTITIPGFYGKITATLPPVGVNELPVPKPGGVQLNATITTPAANQMVILQSAPTAIIDWNTFNIGSKASVFFNQQGNNTWAALNRIWDKSPSQIYGTLKADGAIYLINQNGILFGPGSQVNVYSLVASSLNIKDSDFLNGLKRFRAEDYNDRTDNEVYGAGSTGAAPGTVSNIGDIQTIAGGSVFLIGPQVENIASQEKNSGTITSVRGQIGLVAGTDVELVTPAVDLKYPGGTEYRTALVVKVNNAPAGSAASNLAGGYLTADTGLVGMYGNIVNQNGVIRSMTAVARGGHVELFASDTVNTGKGSLIYLPVSPSSDKVSSTFTTSPSSVIISGLDSTNPANPTVSPNLVVHEGAIVAPSGLVTMNAASRVYLGPKSLIDVSGLRLGQSADANLLSVQLNTYNLRDNFPQKGGLLQGQTVKISRIAGASIGDVSGTLSIANLTAAERHTAGGTVNINAGLSGVVSDIIVRDGAAINFSGGEVQYAGGALNTTMLVSGNKVYSISNADTSVAYDSVLNSQTFAHKRFGVTETYSGVYYGGASPIYKYTPRYTVGDDAGTLTLHARTVVLDGTLLGQATNGIFQTLTTEPANSTGNQSASGYVQAKGGTLEIGDSQNNLSTPDKSNLGVNSITVSARNTPLASDFTPTDAQGSLTALSSTSTVLPAATLSKAGLSSLTLAANTAIKVEKGAQVTLSPGGAFTAMARRIEQYGTITALSGNINLEAITNMTSNKVISSGDNPNYVEMEGNDRIYLAPGSSLIARGERIDNTGAGAFSTPVVSSGHTSGGSINILDKTVFGDGVIMNKGSLVDVSGGWLISAAGKVTGGDAGSLKLQGYALVLNGELRGQSLVGNKGGSIEMVAGNIDITRAPAVLPTGFNAATGLGSLAGKLTLGAHQLDGTGFTSITLRSVNDIIMENGTRLAPSLAKLADPAPGASSGTAANPKTIQVTADRIGTSAMALTAATDVGTDSAVGAIGIPNTDLVNANGPMNPANHSGRILISPTSGIEAGPGGSIGLTASGIDIYGRLDAPSGTIAATADNTLSLFNGAAIRAEGYVKPGTASSITGTAPDSTPKPGGTVSLTAKTGELILEPGSLVSVSGSAPVTQRVVNTDGTTSSVSVAGAPGSILLSFNQNNDLSNLAGTLQGKASMTGLQGGALSITKTDPTGKLSISMDDLERFKGAGFDALTLASAYELGLTGSGKVSLGRALTLDALKISASGSDQAITLDAPWVQVQSKAAIQAAGTSGAVSLPSAGSLAQGQDASISLTGGFIDVTGYALFSGFKNVSLAAGRDIRLTDVYYSGTGWKGTLLTEGDLTLQAARVYPTTQSNFTVSANGKVTILPSGVSPNGPIFSAGGSLTIKSLGAGIDQEGYLAAPMGALSLQAPNGRVYLGEGSATTVKGSAAVQYGAIQEDGSWKITDHATNNLIAVQSAPAGSISITGSEVIVRDKAKLDVSGGGSVLASQFVPSYTGTNNPLSGSYVVVPGVVLPGKAIYLAGGQELPAGAYSLLPALDDSGNPTSYVFMRGAMIVTDLGTTIASSKRAFTSDGSPIVAGYATTMGTGIRSQQYEAYEVRSAASVLKQGQFEAQAATAGNAGSITIAGSRAAIVDGTILASALPGYSGGSIVFSAPTVTVQQSTVPLSSDFGFDTALPAGLDGTLNIAAPALSGGSFKTIGLGFTDLGNAAGSISASKVTVKEGATLQAENIILAARDSITLESNAQVLALASQGGTGEASLIAPTGTVSIGPNAVVRASDAVTLQVGTLSLDPTATLKADAGLLNLIGSTITIAGSNAVSPSGSTGFFLSAAQWNSLANNFNDISLIAVDSSGSSGSKAGSVVLNGLSAADSLAAVKDTLTIDAGLVTGRVGNTESTATLAAQTIVLQNTSGAATLALGSRGTTGEITLQAREMMVGKGSILFDGFKTVTLNAANNLTFRGAGEVPTNGSSTFRAAGSLLTGGADLNIATARVTTAAYMEPEGTALAPVYTAANFKVDAGGGVVNITKGAGTAGTTYTPGGTLEIDGSSVSIGTLVQVRAGQVKVNASGNITLGGDGALDVSGTEYAPGGAVSLKTTGTGSISLLTGSVINVSGGSQGDAGSISLYAPTGGVNLQGTVTGKAGTTTGLGGSFDMVTNTLAAGSATDFSTLNTKLAAGGFTETLGIRATSGSITVGSGDTVRARNVKITTDGGDLSLYGKIDASQTTRDAGTVELNAGNNLTIASTGAIDARSSGGKGGEVSLNAGHIDPVTGWSGTGSLKTGVGTGSVTMNAGSLINVSGNAPGTGGKVHFRAYRSGDTSNINLLGGTITGASDITAETAQAYQLPGGSNVGAYSTYVVNPAAITSNLNASAPIRTLSGIEIQSPGSLTLNTDWDLTSVRPGSQPGVLTIRAAGDLTINGNIVDHPVAYNAVRTGAESSWGINLTAGTDLGSADVMAVKPAGTQGASSGTLTIGSTSSGKAVYTESGSIRFASGGDTVMSNTGGYYAYPTAARLTLGTYSGQIEGDVKGNLILNGGVIQSAKGGIGIGIDGNLALNQSGANYGTIRTTGQSISNSNTDYSTYTNGGSINLSVGGNVEGKVLSSLNWLMVTGRSPNYKVVPNYANSQVHGIVATGGGDVSVRTGGNFVGQTGIFGAGDLTVHSGGDLEGRFLIKEGTGTLSAMGNFGVPKQYTGGALTQWAQLIEMYDARVNVTAQGNVELGAVVNPTLAASAMNNIWDATYTPNSSISLRAVTGDVNIYNSYTDPAHYGAFYDDRSVSSLRFMSLPASVEINAGRDINISGTNETYIQLPAADGRLSMMAGRDIVFSNGAAWLMSDADPTKVYVNVAIANAPDLYSHGSTYDNSLQANVPIHYYDNDPVEISAGRNIQNMNVTLPKKAVIKAGSDITDLTFSGQNIHSTDTTVIAAQGNMLYGYTGNVDLDYIRLSGPGYLMVEAGGRIDLGASGGIQAVGNRYNTLLGSDGSVIAAAGISEILDPQKVSDFFAALQKAGDQYSPLLSGNPAAARAIIDRARADIISPFLASVKANHGGDLTMTSSQISTSGGGSVSVLATGKVNVGTTLLKDTTDRNTGIFTGTGGATNVFAAGNINVNESRIMTFQGGDITIWSDRGNIYAGKGDKAVVSRVKYQYKTINGKGEWVPTLPAVGSGIRAMTYSLDEDTPAPPIGNLHVFTPSGFIDVGEAGMSGGNVVLGAMLGVLNVANLSFTGTAVGLPSTTQTVGMGVLTGVTNLVDKNTLTQDMGALAAARGPMRSSQALDDLVKWLDVRFLNFDLTSPVATGSEGENP